MTGASLLDKLKSYARSMKQNIYVLYLSYKDPRVPWYAKVFTACVVAYAFSPIDLIPDFIPVIGYLDDLIIVPLGIWFSLKIIPETILIEYRTKAEELRKNKKPKNWITGALFIAIWILCAAWFATLVIKWLK